MQLYQNAQEHINIKLKEKILLHTSKIGVTKTPIEGFNLIRRVAINELRVFYKPFIGLTVQGFKRSFIGSDEYSYGQHNCFVAGVDMPSESYITKASQDEPFLALSLDLNRYLVANLISEMPHIPFRENDGSVKSVAVMEADIKLMQAFLRLLELLDEQDEIPIMAPMLIREIHLRLLIGPQGSWLRSICSQGSVSNQIAKAITYIRENFTQAFNIDDLASKVGMSSSSFYRNFKQVTTLSPLQFQKRLRLYEAQNLMMSSKCTASDAGFKVGYESYTQFIREYKRMFGKPPHKDINQKLENIKK